MIQDIAPHKLKNQYRSNARPDHDSMIFAMQPDTGKVLLSLNGCDIALPAWKLLRSQDPEVTYLLSLDETAVFLLRDPDRVTLPSGFEWYDLRTIRREGAGPQHMMFMAYTAKQLAQWYLDNRWCGRCGKTTVHSDRERALICPHCKKTVYPRLNPAVIVGVTDGDKILVTRYAGRDISYYALIAGFTEIGETLEETVQREVMEEVGLKVINIRYYKSQPWAMADDILMGFYCEVDGDTTITMDTSELKEAMWVTREEVVLQPDTYSLTNEMMTVFKCGTVI